LAEVFGDTGTSVKRLNAVQNDSRRTMDKQRKTAASGIQGHEKTSGRINENPSWNARGFLLETVAAEHGTQHARDLGERLARRGERLRRHRIGLVHHSGRVDGTGLIFLSPIIRASITLSTSSVFAMSSMSICDCP